MDSRHYSSYYEAEAIRQMRLKREKLEKDLLSKIKGMSLSDLELAQALIGNMDSIGCL